MNKAVTGLAWSAVEKWGQQVMNLIVFMVLARLLEPEDFGLIAMASVFSAFVMVFLDQGMATALVQREELDPIYIDTAFWANVLAGIILTIIGVTLSDFVAGIFNIPSLAPIIAWLSLSFFIYSLSSTQQAIIQRKMDFRSLALRSLIAKLVGGVAGVVLAIRGYGVWALVAQSLVTALVALVVLWTVSDWRPRFQFSIKRFKELFSFGMNVMGAQTINFFDLRLDHFLIGYFLGPTLLGYYAIAYRFLLLTQELIMGLTHQVLFATFSRLQKNIKVLRDVFYQATQFISIIVWPLYVGLVITAPEFIIVLFGDKWSSSVQVMQILALSGIPLCTLVLSGNLAVSLGKPSWHLKARFIISIARILGFILAVRWGIVAVAIAFVATNIFIYTPINIWLANRLIRLDFKKYFSYFTAPIIGSVVMTITIFGSKHVLYGLPGLYWSLILDIIIGALSYFGVIWLMRPNIFRQASDLIRRK